MMRCLVLLSAVFLVQADNTAYCSLDGARAVDDLLDAATYIWASVQRCDNKAGNTQADTILCTLDISAAIESVNAMVNVILKAVQKCGHLESESAQCGLAVGVLTRSFAGLAAAGSGIAAKCHHLHPSATISSSNLVYTPGGGVHAVGVRYGNGNNIAAPKQPLVYNVASTVTQSQQSALASAQAAAQANQNELLGTSMASFGQCLVDVKDLTKSLFKAMKRIMTMKQSCADGTPHCAHNTLKLVASLGAMGQYLSNAVGRCSPATVTKRTYDAECAGEVSHLVRHVSNVGRASVDLQQNCNIGAERLYQIEHGEVENQSSNSVTLGLAAMLPLTAVLSFVGGSRFAKTRAQDFGAVNADE